MKIIIIMSLIGFVLSLSSCGGNKIVHSDKQNREGAELNVRLASGYIQRGQLEIAQEKLLKAIELDDEYVPAYTTLAVLKERIGESNEAENYYLEALDLQPDNPQLLNNYGSFLCKMDDVKKLEESIEQFTKALKNKFYRTPYNAHANMGYCLMKNDKYNDYWGAEEHLRKALKSQPNMSFALLSMGELGIKTKRFLMARAYMQRYHTVAAAGPDSLWLQIQAEKALGDQQYFVKLSRELKDKFPDSKETKM